MRNFVSTLKVANHKLKGGHLSNVISNWYPFFYPFSQPRNSVMLEIITVNRTNTEPHPHSSMGNEIKNWQSTFIKYSWF